MIRQSSLKHWTLFLLFLALVLSVVSFGAPAAATAAANAPVTIKVCTQIPPMHWLSVNQIDLWMAKVKQYAGDKVNIEYYPGNQLGKTADFPTLINTGVANVTIMPASGFAGIVPLNTVGGLPLYSDYWKAGNAAWQLVKTPGHPLAEEWSKAGLYPLWGYNIPLYDVWTAKKAVTKLEDMKGMKLRSVGGVMDKVIMALGATPVMLQPGEMAEAMQRGTVDGTVLAALFAPSEKLEDVVKYFTVGAPIPGNVNTIVAGKKWWEQLPPDVQAAIQRASYEVTGVEKKMQEDSVKIVESFEKGGLKSARLTDAEKARWLQAMDRTTEDWIKQMTDKGLPGRKVVDDFKAALAKQR